MNRPTPTDLAILAFTVAMFAFVIWRMAACWNP